MLHNMLYFSIFLLSITFRCTLKSYVIISLGLQKDNYVVSDKILPMSGITIIFPFDIKLLKLTIFELLVLVGWYVINVTLLQTLLTIIAIHLFWHFTTAFLKKMLFLQIYCWIFFIDPQNCFWAWTIELVVFTFVWTKITGHLWGNNWGPPHN